MLGAIERAKRIGPVVVAALARDRLLLALPHQTHIHVSDSGMEGAPDKEAGATDDRGRAGKARLDIRRRGLC